MKSAGDSLEQMLKRHVSSDYYQMAREPYCIEVKELEKGSEALVKFLLPPRSEGIELTLHKRGFSFLLKSQNADGSFLVRHPETGEVDAHIVECKVSVGDDEWRKAKQQMRWTYSRLLALAGVLGISIRSVIFYTAFRNDHLQPDSAPDMIPEKLPIGEETPGDVLPDDIPMGYRLDWEDLTIQLDGYLGEFKHHKIVLDTSGHAEVELCAAAS